MGAGIQLVTVEVKLDIEAIQADATLPQWWHILRLTGRGIDQSWEFVYKEIAAILIGSPIYLPFCKTAYEDGSRFAKYIRAQSFAVAADKPTSAKPVKKVAAMPPPAVKR